MEKVYYKVMEEWINHTIFRRLSFFIVLAVTIIVDVFWDNFIIIQQSYLLLSIFLGFAFWKERGIQFVFVGIFVGFRLYFEEKHHVFVNPDEDFLRYIDLFITYILITLGTALIIRFYVKQKENTHQLTVTLAKALDSRDHYTADHSDNVAYYARKIAQEMKLPRISCEQIYLGGLLHDIGKIGVPEDILKKPTRLTKEEFDVIKQHPVIGMDMLRHIRSFKRSGILDMVLHHHERFDGKGYPHGLASTRIPLFARIMAMADTFDAMTSNRVYRGKLDLEHTINEIRKNSGTQFDPDIVDVFLSIWEREKEGIMPNFRLEAAPLQKER